MKRVVKIAKQRHLITDDGFLRRLVANLSYMFGFISVVLAVPNLRAQATDLYFSIKDEMLRICSENMWWSMLALLSSSCCALQMILNAFSFGCAGFNSYLGPIRPTIMSAMIIAQSASWFVSLTQPLVNVRTTAVSTALSLVMTFLPELLDLHTKRLSAVRRPASSNAASNLDIGRTSSHANEHNTSKAHFRLDTMGCASCVSTVSAIIRKYPVASQNVSLEDGVAEVFFNTGRMSDGDGPDKSLSNVCKELRSLSKTICDEIEAAGFPVSGLTLDGTDIMR